MRPEAIYAPLFDEGFTVEEMSIGLGVPAGRIREALRRTGRLKPAKPSMWDLGEDERKAAFAQRAARGAKAALKGRIG